MSKATVKALLRRMRGSDVSRMAVIGEESGDKISQNQLLNMLSKKGICGSVCEVDDIVLGYMIYEPMENHFHIHAIVVDQKVRRKGIGRHLIKRLLNNLTPRRNIVDVVLRESNLEGQLFMRALGFECDQIMKDYFGDEVSPEEMKWEDGYHFLYLAKE